jgi:hypothetical protein
MGLVLAGLTFAGCVVAVRWSPVTVSLSMVLTMFCFCANTVGFQERFEDQNRASHEMLRFPIAMFSIHARRCGLAARFHKHDFCCYGHARIVCRRGSRRLHFDGTLPKT